MLSCGLGAVRFGKCALCPRYSTCGAQNRAKLAHPIQNLAFLPNSGHFCEFLNVAPAFAPALRAECYAFGQVVGSNSSSSSWAGVSAAASAGWGAASRTSPKRNRRNAPNAARGTANVMWPMAPGCATIQARNSSITTSASSLRARAERAHDKRFGPVSCGNAQKRLDARPQRHLNLALAAMVFPARGRGSARGWPARRRGESRHRA